MAVEACLVLARPQWYKPLSSEVKTPWFLTVLCHHATSLGAFELPQLIFLLDYHKSFFLAMCSCCCIVNPIFKHWLNKIRLHFGILCCPFLRLLLSPRLWEFVWVCNLYWLLIFNFLIILLNAPLLNGLRLFFIWLLFCRKPQRILAVRRFCFIEMQTGLSLMYHLYLEICISFYNLR